MYFIKNYIIRKKLNFINKSDFFLNVRLLLPEQIFDLFKIRTYISLNCYYIYWTAKYSVVLRKSDRILFYDNVLFKRF